MLKPVPSLARALLPVMLVMLSVGPRAALAEPPRVVADVAPIHSLVAQVMEGVGEPALLMPSTVSPHVFALRPTQAAKLENADVLFWVGSALTPWLTRILDSLAGDARTVELMETPGLSLLSMRPAGGPQARQGDGPAGPDPHIWLDPQNAAAIVDHVADTLADMDPANAVRYRTNAREAKRRLVALERELAGALAPARHATFIVFHDAYQYFEQRFGVRSAGAVTFGDAAGLSARRIDDVREAVARTGAVCLFLEPQHGTRLARAVREGTPLRVETLDPLGAGIPQGPRHHEKLLRALAHGLEGCLTRRA